MITINAKENGQESKEISIIDYVITSQEYMKTTKSMEMKKNNIESTK